MILKRKKIDLWMVSVAMYVIPFVNGWVFPYLEYLHFDIRKAIAFQFLAIPLAVLVYLLYRDNLSLSDMGFVGRGNPNASLVGIHALICMCLLPIIFFSSMKYAYRLGFSGGHSVIYDYIPHTFPLGIVACITMAIVIGLVEEFHFQGCIISLLNMYSVTRWKILLIVPLLFGAVHWEGGWRDVLATWIFSNVEVLYFLRYRMIFPLICGHATTDFIAFAMVI